uniref:Uncharacterized protein n=1 Tax=Helianthus annuus TaxID=4232 RepID=A0A251TTM0_HELAN
MNKNHKYAGGLNLLQPLPIHLPNISSLWPLLTAKLCGGRNVSKKTLPFSPWPASQQQPQCQAGSGLRAVLLRKLSSKRESTGTDY